MNWMQTKRTKHSGNNVEKFISQGNTVEMALTEKTPAEFPLFDWISWKMLFLRPKEDATRDDQSPIVENAWSIPGHLLSLLEE